MARIKGGLNAKKRHNRVLKLAKGYYGARSKQYRIAKQSVMRALTPPFAEKERFQKAVDRTNQCGSTYERHKVQRLYARP